MFNWSRVFAHSLLIKTKRWSGGEPLPLAFGEKPSKLVHLLYISLKCINLAIILLEYLLFDPRAKRRPKLSKKFQGCTSPLPLTSRA